MNIYTDDGTQGVLDFAKAKHELEGVSSITNAESRRAALSELTTAALLDIAYSLRSVGAEASLALLGSGVLTSTEPEADEPTDDRDFLVVGDLVHRRDDTEPGEVVKVGVTEGETFADVAFANGSDGRYFQRDLVRLRGDNVDPEFVETIVESVGEAVTTDDETADPADGYADDLDDDFEGDNFTAAASALDTLRANEAARKAAKKKGGKK